MDEVQRARLETDLDNWGAWARSGSGKYGACGSAEHYYVAPRDDDNTQADKQSRDKFVEWQAEEVERAMCLLRNRRWKVLLKMIYVERSTELQMAKFLNVSVSLVSPARIAAHGAIQYQLEVVREPLKRLHSAA